MSAPDRSQRSCVVTGAAWGIGRAVATRLAADGWAVTGVDLDAARLADLAAAGPGIEAAPGDVCDPGVLARAAASAAALAPLRGWVNNAALFAPGTLDHAPRAEVERVLATNLTAAIDGARVALGHMLAGGGGAIVNVSSLQATQPIPGWAVYATAKAGVEGLTRALAVDHAAAGVRVNAVAPGTIVTERLLAGLDALPDGEGAARLAELEALHPRGRLGTPEDVAAVVAFLLSDAAANVTGAVVPVDGGRSVVRRD